MTNIYDCARDIIDIAESTQDIEKVAEVLATQRKLLNQRPRGEISLLIVVPTKLKQIDLDERYPLLMVGYDGLEVAVPDWKSEMRHREMGFTVKRDNDLKQ